VNSKLELHGPTSKPPAKQKQNRHNMLCSVYKLQEAAKSGFLSPQQAARQIRAGAPSWLLLVQPEELDTLGLMAAGTSDETPEDTPGLVKERLLKKLKRNIRTCLHLLLNALQREQTLIIPLKWWMVQHPHSKGLTG